jgi:hypothetical protein
MAKPLAIDVLVECTLAEFYNGSQKTVKFFKSKLRHDGKSVERVEESLNV